MNLIKLFTSDLGQKIFKEFMARTSANPEDLFRLANVLVPQVYRLLNENSVNLDKEQPMEKIKRYEDATDAYDFSNLMQYGEMFMEHLLSSGAKAESVAEEVSRDAGVEKNLVKELLPVLTVVLGAARESEQNKLASNAGSGAMDSLLKGLDSDGDGQVLDDVLAHAGALFGNWSAQ